MFRCSDGHSTVSEGVTSLNSKESTVKKIGSCLLKNVKTPQNLLSDSDVLRLTGFSKDNMSINYEIFKIMEKTLDYEFEEEIIIPQGNYNIKKFQKYVVGFGDIKKWI